MKYKSRTCFEPVITCPVVFLKQGQFYISDHGPAQVRTILGSCVTVTMHCPVQRIGGITHSLLPYPLPGTKVPYGHHGRFVNSSVHHIFEQLLSLGIRRSSLEVKIFGGGRMLSQLSGKQPAKEINIGKRNVETALNIIQELGLRICATDVGGRLGRKLMFYPHRGDVWVKKINRIGNRSEFDG